MADNVGTTIAITAVGLAGVAAAFVIVDRLTKAQQPFQNPNQLPAQNPGNTPAPNPGNTPAPNPGGSAPPANSGTPGTGSSYTYGDRCKELQNQRNTYEGLQQTAQQKMDGVMAEVEAHRRDITHRGLGCIWDCNWHLEERSKRINAYVRGEPVSGYWNEQQLLEAADGAGVNLREYRKRYLKAKSEYDSYEQQIKDIDAELLKLSKQGVRC